MFASQNADKSKRRGDDEKNNNMSFITVLQHFTNPITSRYLAEHFLVGRFKESSQPTNGNQELVTGSTVYLPIETGTSRGVDGLPLDVFIIWSLRGLPLEVLITSLNWCSLMCCTKEASRSSKYWGGEILPVSREMRSKLVEIIFPDMDMNLLGVQSPENFEKIWYTLFRTRGSYNLVLTCWN